MASLHGADVSDYQGRVDWARAARHLDFVYVQIAFSTGRSVCQTGRGVMNLRLAKRAGLKVGAYYYAYPLAGVAQVQAQEAAKIVRQLEAEGLVFDLPFALDVEVNPGSLSKADMSGWIRDWLDATKMDPRRLAVYTYPAFWQEATDQTAINAHLWVAAYGSAQAPRLKGLPRPFAWQMTEKGQVPGIDGPVDLDVLLFEPTASRTRSRAAAPPPNVQETPAGAILRPSGSAR